MKKIILSLFLSILFEGISFSQVSEKYQKFMESNLDGNNMIFSFEDLLFVTYANGPTKIRVIWNDFDSEWTMLEAKKTLKKFEKFVGE
jgi:hypothetical protein